MKAVGLDSSVVLRLLTGEPADQAQVAMAWLREARAAGIIPVIGDLVASETYFALQHHFGISKADALQGLALLLSGGDVKADGALAAVLAVPGLASANPGFVDRLIHAHYTGVHGRGMATFERAARGLPGAIWLGSRSA